MSENFDVRLKQAHLAGKSDIDDFVKNTYFHQILKKVNKKVTSNKTKHVQAEKN